MENADIKNLIRKKECQSGAVSAVFVMIDEGILYLKRADNDKIEGGMYGIPAGHLKDGENAIDAAIRETFEESGLKINPTELQFITDMNVNVRYTKGGEFSLHIFVFFADKRSVGLKDIKICDEHSSAVAISIDDMRALLRADSKGIINLRDTFTLFDISVIKGHLEKIAELSNAKIKI